MSFARRMQRMKRVLQKCNETQFVSNNTELQRIFYEIEFGHFLPNTLIETHIFNADWKEFDKYCANSIGIENFWSILQNIFYLSPHIDTRSLQIALGIQQVRWSVDPENDFQTKLTHNLKYTQDDTYSLYYDDVEFKYFFEIDNENQHYILSEFSDALKLDYGLISEHLQNTIWYEVSGRKDDLGTMKPFGTGRYYGIPASYDFSKLTCTHQPSIVFGQMKSSTMVSYILKTKKRPYAGHLPGSRYNLTYYDDVEAGILCNWYHDLYHQKNGFECDVEKTVQRVLESCKKTRNELFGERGLDWSTKKTRKCLKNETLSLELTDNGDIFEQYLRKSGGRKRTTRRQTMLPIKLIKKLRSLAL